MAKTDDRASQYVFVEDEDIFEEDEKRLAARKQESGWMVASTASPVKVEVRYEAKPAASRFHRDPAKIERDAAKLRRGLKQLKAVPPPPSTTNPQFTFSNILELWHKHNKLGELKSKWIPGHSEEKLGYDVYLNTNDYVEKLEDHRQDLTKCFVYNETASHVTGVPPLRTEQDKQLQKRNGWLQSPATRTNNLSQRKAFFSQFSNSVRTFTVENNKKFSFLKSHSESKIVSKAHVTKRALFQSPEKPSNVSQPYSNHSSSSSSLLPPSNYSVPSAASTASSSSSNSFITPSRSMLNRWIASRGEANQGSSSSGKARDASVKRSCSKSLKFDGPSESDKKVRVASIAKELSQHHHEKMLWAVQTLLKSEGVSSNDPEYKSLFANIYQETTQVWVKHYENKPRSRNSTSGTCDLMVRVAKKILPSVEQKLGLSCSTIKGRKEMVKKNVETSILPLNDSVTIVASKPKVKSSESDPSDKVKVIVEDVFSPEMMGVSNLCDDIDAVISSLDNLPPDPGDNNSTVLFANNSSSLSVSTSEKDSSHPVIKDLLSAPLLSDKKTVGTLGPNSSGQSSSSPLNLVTNNSDDSSISCNVLNVSAPSDIKVAEIDVTESNNSNDIKCSLGELPEDGVGEDVVECLATSSFNLPHTLDIKIEEEDPIMTKDKDVSSVSELCDKTIPTCVVKLHRYDYFVANSENVKTPEQCYTSRLKFKNSSDSVENLNGYKTVNKKEAYGVCGLDIELSPCKSSSGSSDLKRSKRKRNSGTGSSENTPVQSKYRSSKRLCSKQVKDTDKVLNAPRRSSRGRLSFDEGSKIQHADKENGDADITVPLKNYDNIDKVSSHDSQTVENIITDSNDKLINDNDNVCLKEIGSSDVCNISEDTMITADQLAESSSTADKSDGKSGRLDKENDSSMENMSDVDTQNWSPILKLKRSSKNMWSSELKKKRISSRCKKENSENSPASSPFLDLEGPFKYRLCKRALPGEFVSAIIKGEIYVNKLKKLVKKRVVTKDCVLVRTVQEGLELRIPVELFKNECVFLGPNNFQNMISDIVEDAVCKLEGFDSDMAFNGFTNHDINRAVLASCSMDRIVKVIEKTGQVVKPLFTMYKYAIVKQSPQNVQDFYQIFVEILRTSLFIKKSTIDQDTIQVRPIKSESPKKIQLEINIPVNLLGANHRLKDSILRDLTPVHNIISC